MPHDRLIALWRYEAPVDAVIRGLKFSRLPGLAAPLAGLLAKRLGREEIVADVVVPVPLHWRRRLSRGFDQSEEIARHLARRMRLPLRRALRRRRSTRPQSRLQKAERAQNVRMAFSGRRNADIAGCYVLLIDDVVTSGATLRAAAHQLRLLGARRVTAAVLAHTPNPS